MPSTQETTSELTGRVDSESDPLKKAQLLVELSDSLLYVAPAEAKTRAEQALELGRAAGAEGVTAQALSKIASAQYNLSNYADVAAPCQESLRIAVKLGDAGLESQAASLLGLVAGQSGDYDRAFLLLQQAEQAGRKARDEKGVMKVYENFGYLNKERGELDQALEYHSKALELSEHLQEPYWIGFCHTNVAVAYQDLGDWEKAVEHYYRAIVVSEKEHDYVGMAVCYIDVAQLYLRRGKHDRAMDLANQAIMYADRAQSPFYRLAALGICGEVAVGAGDYVRASSIFDSNLKLSRELNLPKEELGNLRRKAELRIAEVRSRASGTGDRPESRIPNPDLREAIALLHQALPIAERLGNQMERAQVQWALGRAYDLVGDTPQARGLFESAASTLKPFVRSFELAQVNFDYGRFLVEREQRRAEGLSLVQDAARIFKRLEMINESGLAERYLFRMGLEQDRRLGLLRSLSTLAVHSLPLPEFAPRCLDTLKDALGSLDGTFFVDERRPVKYGAPCPDEDLAACRRGELIVSNQALCLPLRLSGRNVGGIFLRMPAAGQQRSGIRDSVLRVGEEPSPQALAPKTQNSGQPEGLEAWGQGFFEIVSNLLSVAMERNRAQTPVPVAPPGRAPEACGAAPATRYPGFVGRSPPMLEIYDTIDQVAPTNACVLIRGDSGTGKELIAQIIRKQSSRANEPLVALNCAAIPETLLESELFGIEKGVATGVSERKGKFEQAHRGTLFLDEIGDISLVLQAKLLRVLQEQSFERVGGHRTIAVDVRIIAATNRDLGKLIADGKFREDLYYRLNVVTISLPPLRDRPEDIPLFVQHFVDRYNEEFQRHVRGISQEVLSIFLRYSWPGNVRELENAVMRAVILCRSDWIQAADLPPAFKPQPGATGLGTIDGVKGLGKKNRGETGAILEKNLILAALRDNNGSATKAARQLDISRSHFYRLLKELDIKP